MSDHRLGRGYNSRIEADWRIERWTGTGLNDWKDIDENRLTRAALAQADQIQISIIYDNGDTVYRTFRGPLDYDNIDEVIDYWINEGSL